MHRQLLSFYLPLAVARRLIENTNGMTNSWRNISVLKLAQLKILSPEDTRVTLVEARCVITPFHNKPTGTHIPLSFIWGCLTKPLSLHTAVLSPKISGIHLFFMLNTYDVTHNALCRQSGLVYFAHFIRQVYNNVYAKPRGNVCSSLVNTAVTRGV